MYLSIGRLLALSALLLFLHVSTALHAFTGSCIKLQNLSCTRGKTYHISGTAPGAGQGCQGVGCRHLPVYLK
ncbi:hypothetical protein F5883DRAFT_534003 [Diaporthe sp. PMI_573]|nr:hypothetical protein F5883DRAFT_534003 [Diaporthaceae sp. PMI_573]